MKKQKKWRRSRKSFTWYFVSVKQSGSQGRGKERKGDIKAIAGSLEHFSFAFAGKQINERYGITLHQQTCAGEVELKLSAGLLRTGCIQIPNIVHSPITAGGLVSEVLYESDQPVVHSRHKEFLSILCQTLSENPQRRDRGTYHTVSWILWTVLL